MDQPRNKAVLLTGTFLALFAAGSLWPEPLWGLSHLRYLPVPLLLPLLLLLGGILWWGFARQGNGLIAIPLAWQKWLPPTLALLMGILAYSFRIPNDAYGDGLSFLANLQYTVDQWDPRLWDDLLYFNPVDSKIGSATFYALVNTTAFLVGGSTHTALFLLEALALGAWTWIWSSWVFRRIHSPHWQLALLLGGLCSPVTLNFAGHYETYAFSLVAYLGFFAALDRHFERPGWKPMAVLALTWLLTTKFHITSLLLLPFVGLAALWWWGIERKTVQEWWTFKNALLWGALPGLVVVLVVYLGFWQGWDAPRSFTDEDLISVMFLPVQAPEGPPLDRYNLFSPAHLIDYFNQIFLWGPGIVLAGLGLFFSGKRKGSSPLLLAFFLAFVAFCLIFFLLNPLLSMPVDWDLLSLPAPALMALVLEWVRRNQEREGGKYLAVGSLALSMLGASFFWLHTSERAVGQRYEDIGKWAFKTYWIGTSTQIIQGVRTGIPPEAQPQRLESLLQELEPWANPGNDLEYAGMWMALGEMHFGQGAYETALPAFSQAESYQPDLLRLPYLQLSAYFMTGQFDLALAKIPGMVRQGYPNRQKVLRMAIHTSIEAGDASQALRYSRRLASETPNDDFNNRVVAALENGVSTAQLRTWFRQR